VVDCLQQHGSTLAPEQPQKFTQQQLFACLVLKHFLRVDQRGLCRVLHNCLALAVATELTSIPRFTTFQNAAHRLLQRPQARRMPDETVEQMMGRNPGIRTVTADSTRHRYRQSCQVETTISMIRRRQGSAVRARTLGTQAAQTQAREPPSHSLETR
jgi:hypothetical protein